MKLTNNIISQEVLPEAYHKRYGAKNGMRAINPSTFLGAQYLMDTFNWDSIHMNDWFWGGDFDERGLRIKGHDYYRNGYGLHDHGNALDFVPNIDGEDVADTVVSFHQTLIECPDIREELMRIGVYRVEVVWLANTWIHLDCEYTRNQKDLIFVSSDERFTLEEYSNEIINIV